MKLCRDRKTGNYYSPDKKVFVEKCLKGYDVFVLSGDDYEYSFSADTLSEIREM